MSNHSCADQNLQRIFFARASPLTQARSSGSIYLSTCQDKQQEEEKEEEEPAQQQHSDSPVTITACQQQNSPAGVFNVTEIANNRNESPSKQESSQSEVCVENSFCEFERKPSDRARKRVKKPRKRKKAGKKPKQKKSKTSIECEEEKDLINWKKVRSDLKKTIKRLTEKELTLLYRLYQVKYPDCAPKVCLKTYNNLIELFQHEASGTLINVWRLFNLIHVMDKIKFQKLRERFGKDDFYGACPLPGDSKNVNMDLSRNPCALHAYNDKTFYRIKPIKDRDVKIKNSCSIS